MAATLMRTNRLLAVAIAAVSGALLVGCSEGSSDPRPSADQRSGAAAPRATDPKHADAVDAYRSMWGDLAAAAETSDSGHPRLSAHASGDALDLLRFMMDQDRQKNVVTKGQLRLDPVAKRSDATAVVIRDCADDTGWLHYTREGKTVPGANSGHHRVDATVRQHHGVWRVERLRVGQVGTC